MSIFGDIKLKEFKQFFFTECGVIIYSRAIFPWQVYLSTFIAQVDDQQGFSLQFSIDKVSLFM